MKLLSRLILILLIGAAAVILIAGPRGEVAVPDDVTVVTYWEKWGGPEATGIQAIVDEFNRTIGREKKIFVKHLPISQLDRKALIATAAGVPPDIVGMWDRHVVTFASRDAVIPLDELAARYGIKSSDYKPVYWGMCYWQDHLWSLPTTPAIIGLHYNRYAYYDSAEAIRSAGGDPFRPPRDIAELDKYAEAIDRRDNAGRLTRAGHVPMEPNWYVTTLPGWFGGRLWDAEKGEFYITSPQVIATYEWMQGYPRRLGKDAMAEFSSQFGNFGAPTNPFFTQRVAMVLQGPWTANYAYALKPQMSEVLVAKSTELLLPRAVREFNYQWAVAAFPSVDAQRLPDTSFAQCDVMMIPRGAKHPREAFEYIAFVQRPEVMERLASSHCKGTPLAVASDDFVRKHANPYIGTFERLAKSPNATRTEMSSMHVEVGDELLVGIQRLYLAPGPPPTKYVSVQEAMADVQKRVLRKYREFVERRRLRGDVVPLPAEAGG